MKVLLILLAAITLRAQTGVPASENTSLGVLFIGTSGGNPKTNDQESLAIGYLTGNAMNNAANPAADLFIGNEAGQHCTTCRESTLIGYHAGMSYVGNGTGMEDGINTMVGSQSGAYELGSNNTYVGQKSCMNMANASDSDNVCIGAHAGFGFTSGKQNIFVGRASNFNQNSSVSGTDNVMIGYGAGDFGNLATGYQQHENVLIGSFAGANLQSVTGDIAIGYQAGQKLTTGQTDLVMGFKSGTALTTQGNDLFIGYMAGQTATSSDSVFIGPFAGQTASGNQLLAIGTQAGAHLLDASQSVMIGYQAGLNLQSGGGNTMIGRSAGQAMTIGYASTWIGDGAGFYSNGGDNTGIGAGSGQGIVSGVQNTFIGSNAGAESCDTCSMNVGIGYRANIGGNTTGAAQIGEGTNQTPNTLQFQGATVADANGYLYANTSTPTSSVAACRKGAIWADGKYIYVCIGTNIIRRAPLTQF